MITGTLNTAGLENILAISPTCWSKGELTAMRLADCAGLPLRVSEPDEDEKCSMTSQLDLRDTGGNTGGVCCSGRRADRAGEVESSRLACRLLIAPGKPARPCCRRLKLRRVNRGFPVAAARSCNMGPKIVYCDQKSVSASDISYTFCGLAIIHADSKQASTQNVNQYWGRAGNWFIETDAFYTCVLFDTSLTPVPNIAEQNRRKYVLTKQFPDDVSSCSGRRMYCHPRR